MATASMVLRELFRNKILLFVMVVGGCHEMTQKTTTVIPSVYIQAADVALQQRGGCLYYKGQPLSGHTYEIYPNGDTALTQSYYKGREEGWCRKWYKSQLMEERFYHLGKKEGRHRGWYPGGKPRFDYHFQNDEHEGTATEWFPNGKPARIFTYAKGYEEGLQRMWWEDGSVRANYVVKEGQQYGLIGRKLCRNNETTNTN